MPSISDEPLNWTAPGANPWHGPTIDAFALLGNCGAPAPARLIDILKYGDCVTRPVHDGEVFDGMVFGHGQVACNVIAQTSVWPAAVSREVTECTLRGVAVIRPQACGNWAFKASGPTWSPVLNAPWPSWGYSGKGWATPGSIITAGNGSTWQIATPSCPDTGDGASCVSLAKSPGTLTPHPVYEPNTLCGVGIGLVFLGLLLVARALRR